MQGLLDLIRFDQDDLSNFPKDQFKRKVSKIIRELNKEKLVDRVKITQYKKIDLVKFENDNHLKKLYLSNLSVADGRLKLRIVSSMTPKVKMNFQSDKAFSKILLKCENCSSESEIGVRDTQNHVILCPAFARLREGKTVSKDKDLVDYFTAVIQQRIG